MNKIQEPRIICDVDFTVVDPVYREGGWFDYIKAHSTEFDAIRFARDAINDCIDYNLYNYFTLEDGFDPHSFWWTRGLYDHLEVFPDAAEVLKDLSDMGYKIIMLTHSDYTLSKKAFCHRNLPFITSYVECEHKSEFVRATDIIIDDRVSYIQHCKCAKKILMPSPNRQDDGNFIFDENMHKDIVFSAKNWYDIENIILNKE